MERTRTSTDDRRAWELYHRAETFVQDGDSLRYAGARELADGLYAKAESLYSASHDRDDDWLAPRIARGWLSFKRARLGGAAIDSTDPEWLRAGVEIADGILDDHPGNARALELRGVLRSWLCQVGAVDSVAAVRRMAEQDLRAAITEDPDRARAWVELAEVLRAQGEFDEARTAWRQARQTDAFLSNDGDVLRLGAHLALDLGDLETALEWAREGQQRYPQSAATYLQFHLLAYGMDGAPLVSPDSVWGALRELEEVMGGRLPYARVWVAAALARLGLRDSARSVLERTRADGNGRGRYVAYYEPKVWLNLGDTARALRLLREAVEVHGWPRRYVAEDSWWKPLHGDSAFQALVGKAE